MPLGAPRGPNPSFPWREWLIEHRKRNLLVTAGLVVLGSLLLVWATNRADDAARAGQAPWFAAAGAALLVLGLAWMPFQAWRLRTGAHAGKRRCLHCGARRRQGFAFCPVCGWRTDDEKTAANPAVHPMEKDRFS